MSVKERLPLTQSHVLHLVEVGGRALLVATHPQGVSFLSNEPPGAQFSQVFDEQILRPAGPLGQTREDS
jgi:flagellar biogenesis protein FliO